MMRKIDTILGKQETTKGKIIDDSADLETLKHAQARHYELYQKRKGWEPWWKDIRNYLQPHYGAFDDEDNSKPNFDLRRILNGAAEEYARTFSAGMLSGLTPPSRKWFKMGLINSDDTEKRRAVDARQELMERTYARTNFYNAMHTAYGDLPFGQAPVGVFDIRGTIEFTNYPIGSYALGVDYAGYVCEFARKIKMNAAQIVEQFGYENCPREVQDCMNNAANYSKEFTVCWLVEPNPKQWKNHMGTKNMPYRSIYWLEGNVHKALEVTGFEEFPIAVARYQTIGLSPYAYGAGWYALADSKTLQKMQYDILVAAELAIKPAMQATYASANRINLVPGGVTVLDQLDTVKPLYDVKMDMGAVIQEKMEIEQRIRRAYNAELFTMLQQIENKQMTAQEVIARQQETLSLLGPVTEQLHHEFLNPIMDRVYAILWRNKIFDPIKGEEESMQQLQHQDPISQVMQQLQGFMQQAQGQQQAQGNGKQQEDDKPASNIQEGEDIKVEYISPLAQAQKMSALTGLSQALAFTGQVAQLNPQLVDKMDLEGLLEKYYDDVGLPSSLTRSRDEFAAIQQQKAEAQAAKEQQAMELQSAAPLAQAAKNLTDAANMGNPAARAWMGME